MALINYEDYLEGDEWPSESARPVTDEHGVVNPEMVAIYDMPPQYAVAALHKLVRWARDGGITVEQSEREETRVRNTPLGRLLTRKSLSLDDFELTTEHGMARTPLAPRDLAHELAWQMLAQTRKTAKDESSLLRRLSAEEIGHLASVVAQGMLDNGFVTYKEDL